MTDGLSQLAQRGRKTREIPPPRNPARAKPVQLAPVPDEPAPPQGGVEFAELQPSPKAKKEAPAALKAVTMYLEHSDDDFLENITHTRRTSQPKIAVSRSAVVRLALERLERQLSPTEIINELRARGDQQTIGRKRR